jgi:hypothetical protein
MSIKKGFKKGVFALNIEKLDMYFGPGKRDLLGP